MILASISKAVAHGFDRKVLWGISTIDDAHVMQEENCSDA